MARFTFPSRARRAKPHGWQPDDPLFHADHVRPSSRRDFLRQGMMVGAGAALLSPLSLLFGGSRAHAALSPDVQAMKAACGLAVQGAGKIPFLCFDLAGGANIAGSNVLVGKQGGQQDFLSAAGYSKLGVPGNMLPNLANAQTGTRDFINTELGLAFHSDSAFLRGILERTSPATRANINGAIIPARSENDTGNNPHNPMFGINRCGADGSLLTLIGSQNSLSGGNSMAPTALIDERKRPTKVDRPTDVTSLVDVGDLTTLLAQEDAVAVMESMLRISDRKLGRVQTKLERDASIKQALRCGYVKSADLADRFGNPATLNPALDSELVGASGIFTGAEFDGDGEFRKTASVLKLVANGFAGAGTITMGGFDYHTGDRATGERRDLRAGRCMGACLEYAARIGVPMMVYVCSDGSVSSNGMLDNSVDGRGKGQWTGDNQQTAASFFLVYNPNGRPQLLGANADEQARHQQLGWFRAEGDVETSGSPAANNVNLLVEMVLLNYLALHGEQGRMSSLFPAHGLGPVTQWDRLTAFAPIVSGTIG